MNTFNAPRMLLFGAMLTLGAFANAQPEETPIIQLINELADKPENHQAIASYYKTMAEEARDKAEMHRTMKTTYSHSHEAVKGVAVAGATAAHCDRLIELSLAEAEEYEALAAVHAQ